MHGTGLFAAVSTLAGSGTVVLIDRPGLDVVDVWDTVEREAVGNLTIVGDVFARPLLDALDAEPDRWDLSSLAGDRVVGRPVQRRREAGPARAPAAHDDRRLARRVRRARPAQHVGRGRRPLDRGRASR